jgi:hypothetical protein
MNKIHKLFLVTIFISFILPSIALASWWNPFSWRIFNKKIIPQEEILNVDIEVTKEDNKKEESKETEIVNKEVVVEKKSVIHQPEAVKKPVPIIVQTATTTPVSATTSLATTSVSTSTDKVKFYSVDEVYKIWEPYVVSLKCTLIKDGQTYYGKGGTGLVINHFKDGPSILMSRHDLQNNVKGVWTDIADYCDITFPKSDYSFRVEKQNFRVSTGELTVQDRMVANSGDIDVAHLVVSSRDQYISNLLKDYSLNSCESISKGDPLMIMGIPVSKSQNKVSHVTGLIDVVRSGYTGGDFIITTAPAEADYSGGPAVRIKDNCYLGIQTRNDSSDKLDLYYLFINGNLRYLDSE